MTTPFRPQPKPQRTTASDKRSQTRTEAMVKKAVRAAVMERDQGCRFPDVPGLPHSGMLEWAHLEDYRRAKTGGLEPSARHSTNFTAMMCTAHHQLYDAERLTVRLVFDSPPDGANRLMKWYYRNIMIGVTGPYERGQL